MAKETAGLLDQLEFLLLTDDDARWKAMGWIITIVGLSGSIDLALLDSSVDEAVFLMGALLLILSIAWIGWYCSFRHPQSTEPSLSRRRLVLQAVTGAVGFSVAVSLWRFQARALTSEFSQASEADDYDAAIHVLERARSADVRLSKVLVREAGHRFIDAAGKPEAWDAALACVSYKSFLNSGYEPSPGPLLPVTSNAELIFENRFNVTLQIGFLGRTINPTEYPQMRFLDSTYPNPRRVDPNRVTPCPEYIKVIGNIMTLDDFYLKRIIFENVHIVYHGGRMRLENVYFVNCTFEFDQQPRERDLNFAKSVLDAYPLSFSAA